MFNGWITLPAHPYLDRLLAAPGGFPTSLPNMSKQIDVFIDDSGDGCRRQVLTQRPVLHSQVLQLREEDGAIGRPCPILPVLGLSIDSSGYGTK